MSELLLKLTTQPDDEGYFHASTYSEIKDSTLVKEKSIYYQQLKYQIKVPKSKLEQINLRIQNQQQNEMKNLQKEDTFIKDVYFMPTDFKSVLLRNTQRQCAICKGPHPKQQCPLKDQKEEQNKKITLQPEETTYSVRLEPLPTGWEKPQITEFVQKAFSEIRDQQSKIYSVVSDLNKEIAESKSEKETAILEFRKAEIQKELDQIATALKNCIPRRIPILTDKKCPTQKFAFIHFTSKVSAEMFAKRRESVRIAADNIVMHCVLLGEFKKK